MTRFLPAIVCVAFASACANALPESTDVMEPRVIGALVGVVGDEMRSTPRAGERVDVELVVVEPAARVARSAAFVVCLPAESVLDVGLCETVIPNGHFEASALSLDAPRFTIDVPDAATLGDAKTLLVHGAVCAGELAPDVALETFPDDPDTTNPCRDRADVGELVTFRILLESETTTNRRPVLAGLTLDGEPWTQTAPDVQSEGGCTSLDLPMVVSNVAEHVVGMTLAAGGREIYVNVDEGASKEEVPFVAYYATAGDFPGALAFFENADDTSARWIAIDDHDPVDVPAEGLLVRFAFLLRDGRGGTDALERAVCVVPE